MIRLVLLLALSSPVAAFAAGIPVTEISDFQGLVEVAVDQLPSRLIESDPRWDPWLHQIIGQKPASKPSSGTSPRLIAALSLLAVGIILLLLVVFTPQRRNLKAWPRPLVVLAAGTWLAVSALPSGVGRAGSLTLELYRHHLWFQSAFPYGAAWEDYSEGKAITLTGFTHSSGVVRSAQVPVITPDEVWFERWVGQMSPENVARQVTNVLP